EAKKLAQRATALGKEDAEALHTAGFEVSLGDDHESGPALIDRSLALDPNLAATGRFSGWLQLWTMSATGALLVGFSDSLFGSERMRADIPGACSMRRA